jgi:predicted house-cleaning noncanonical NTP pyrophosphatase (MazG superfamily)
LVGLEILKKGGNMGKKYDKLVRDMIPEIIKTSGKTPICHTETGELLLSRLKEKAREELEEFLENSDKNELADMLTVLRAICSFLHMDVSDTESVIENKNKERGGFEKGIILDEVLED